MTVSCPSFAHTGWAKSEPHHFHVHDVSNTNQKSCSRYKPTTDVRCNAVVNCLELPENV